MRTAHLVGPERISVVDVEDVPEPRDDQVILDILAVGLCGSDLHVYHVPEFGKVKVPFTLGHEAVGRIVTVGPLVQNLRVGQRVAIDPATHCGHCEFCLSGRINLCPDVRFIGSYPIPGALSEQLVHPAQSCVAIPDQISDIEAMLLEPLSVAVHVMKLAQIDLGQDVAVLGSGAIGLLLIKLARLSGARRIFATDLYSHRLDFAANYGADTCFNATQVDIVEEIHRATNGRGVDVVIEAAYAEDTLNQSVRIAARGGRIIVVGMSEKDSAQFSLGSVRSKELTLVFSKRATATYPTAIALAKQVNLEPLASHCFCLDETPAAFNVAAHYKDNVVRAVVLPQEK